MGNAFAHDGVYGVKNLVVCELKKNKLYIPYYLTDTDKNLKWFEMGVGTKYENGTIMHRYIETKSYKAKAGCPVILDEHLSFYKTPNKGYVMKLDDIEFERVPSKYPDKKFRRLYVTNNVTKKSIISQIKHHCFTLSMCVNQKTVDYSSYDIDNLYLMISKEPDNK